MGRAWLVLALLSSSLIRLPFWNKIMMYYKKPAFQTSTRMFFPTDRHHKWDHEEVCLWVVQGFGQLNISLSSGVNITLTDSLYVDDVHRSLGLVLTSTCQTLPAQPFTVSHMDLAGISIVGEPTRQVPSAEGRRIEGRTCFQGRIGIELAPKMQAQRHTGNE